MKLPPTRPSLVLLAAVAAACGGEPGGDGGAPAREAAAPLPNVLLVTIDTLRADHLSCYGYFRETSPNIDALAAEGILFERAISTSGTTLPAHLSMFTGLYPHQHGFVANRGAIEGAFEPTPGRVPIAEAFRRAGYVTAGFVSGSTVKRTTGIHAGFDHWDQPETVFDQPRTVHRVGSQTNARVLPWLERYGLEAPRKPFFLWVHYWDVHEPNDPPEPFASVFEADADLEELIERRGIDAERLEELFDDREIARMFFPALYWRLLAREELEVPAIDRSSVLALHDAYDGSVRFVDHLIGELLAELEEHGLDPRTVVAVAGDHGQALGQHDWLEHGRIRGAEVHVPLVLRFPPGLVEQPRRVERVVSLVDLMPTVVARIDPARFAAFLEQAAGEDVLDAHFERAFAFSHRAERDREHWEPGRMFGITTERWRYYHHEGGTDQLYDLAADPGETRDVATEHPREVAKLRELVRALLAQRPAGEGGRRELSEAELRHLELELRTFGYTGDEDH